MNGLEMKYFVLKPKGTSAYAFASRMALLAYAAQIKRTNPELAKDLRLWYEKETDESTVQTLRELDNTRNARNKNE